MSENETEPTPDEAAPAYPDARPDDAGAAEAPEDAAEAPTADEPAPVAPEAHDDDEGA